MPDIPIQDEDIEMSSGHHIIEDFDNTENLYQSCCGNRATDKRLLVLTTQISISVLTVCFAGAMLATSDERDDKAIYLSLLTSTLSYWFGASNDSLK